MTDAREGATLSLEDVGTGLASASLRAAVERVAGEWTRGGVDRVHAAEIAGELELIARALDEGREGLPPCDGAHRALRQRLLWPLRLALTQAWIEADPPPDTGEILRSLRLLEALRADLHVDPPGWSPLGLTAPEGFEMVVEVAHDLRSPLTSILFLAETLRRGQSGEVNDLQRRQLGLIYSAALGLVSLAGDLMELAQGGDRLVNTTPSPFSVHEVLESACDIVRPLAEEKKIALRVLPVVGDQRIGFPAALSRVLVNLVSNALKYTQEGFVEITARARGLAMVEFAVRDTGPGIREEARDTLFVPFRRGPGSDRQVFSGTGLGLAISRRLVQVMGSDLHYETAPAWGTRFYFELDLPPAGV